METPVAGIHRLQGPARSTVRPLNRIVYGYIPYWVDAANPIHWDLLSHLAYFAIEQNADGTINQASKTRLAGARYKQLRDDAKANGVKFVLTFTNFNASQITTLVGANRTAAINTIVQVVKDNGGEGVNVDYEMVPKAAKANFVTFMAELTTRMHTEIPGSHVTLAGPSIDSTGAYDYDELLTKSDGIMIMYYGCHWGGSSNAGPLAPLTAGARWSSKCNLQWVIADYFQWGGQENRKNVIVGLPFYGRRWPTASDQIGAATLGSGGSEVYTKCKTRFATDRRWDADSQTPWTAYMENGQQQQTWCDDAESIDLKLEYMVQQDVGGLGIWALGYDGTEPEMWEKIENRLTDPPVIDPPENVPPVAVVTPVKQDVAINTQVTLDGTQSHDPEGKPLTFAWRKVSGPDVQLSSLTADKPTFKPTIVGTYRFWLNVNDGELDSPPAEATVVVGQPEEPEETIDPQPTNPGGGNGENVQTQGTDPTVTKKAGCGCRSTPNTADLLLAVGVAVAIAGVRRRRR